MNYQTETFLDKNRDYVVVEHCNLLASSRCPFIAGLFPPLPEESSRSSYKFSSVASRFKVQNFSALGIVLTLLQLLFHSFLELQVDHPFWKLKVETGNFS